MSKYFFNKSKRTICLFVILALIISFPLVAAGNAETATMFTDYYSAENTDEPTIVLSPQGNYDSTPGSPLTPYGNCDAITITPPEPPEVLIQTISEIALSHLFTLNIPIIEEIEIAESTIYNFDNNNNSSTQAATSSSSAPAAPAPPPSNYTKWSNVNIVINDNVNQELVDRANDQLALIPGHLLSAFAASPWTISVTSRCIDSLFFNGRFGVVAGGINFHSQQILIQNHEWAVNSATIHEFGHWLDAHRGFVSQSDEFLAIYHAEGNAFFDAIGYSNRDPFELFAEAFCAYIRNPAVLRNSAPQLYQFMGTMI